MLPVTGTTVRLFLHVLAAAVWVGGQLTLAATVPAVRPAGPAALRALGRRFQRLAWPAFGVLAATGIWNLLEADLSVRGAAYLVTLGVKLGAVGVSGAAAGFHVLVAAPRVRRALSGEERRRAAAASGAAEGIATLSGVAAMFLGVMLRG